MRVEYERLSLGMQIWFVPLICGSATIKARQCNKTKTFNLYIYLKILESKIKKLKLKRNYNKCYLFKNNDHDIKNKYNIIITL